MQKTMRFSTFIQAPRRQVWRTMLGPDAYRQWTSAFCEGSYYEGSWEQGRPIRFLDPQGNGLVSEVAEHRTFERISVRHLGVVQGGTDDTESEQARAWDGSYENYLFADEGEGTRLEIEAAVPPAYEEMMLRLWPAALERLKGLCEAR